MDSYRLIDASMQDDVCCIRLRRSRLEEIEITQLGEEVLDFCQRQTHPQLALSLGTDCLSCLYSVFLARMVAIRNALERLGGSMVLCEVAPQVRDTFAACKLAEVFVFLPDIPTAVRHFRNKPG